MKITTKFNIGDTVWIMEDNKAVQYTIDMVYVLASTRRDGLISLDEYRGSEKVFRY